MQFNSLIIDTNEFYKRAFYVMCKQNQKESSNIIINKTVQLTFSMILKLKKEYLLEDGTIYVLADNPVSKATIRKNLDSTYKLNRDRESDGYYRGIDYLLMLGNYYSTQFKTIRITHLEADDLVPEILNLCTGSTLLCSSDLDWSRCMSENVFWYNHDTVHTQDTFQKKYKFRPTEKTVTLYKTLLGDKSDNIPCINNFTEQMALNLVYNFDDIFEVLDCIKKNNSKAYLMSDYTKRLILTNEKRLITNHNLVYFSECSSFEIKQALIDGSFNSRALSILYKSLDFPPNFDSRVEDHTMSFGDIFNFEEINRK